jgi:hypothetical protein
MAAPKDKDELIVRQSQMERSIEMFHLLEIKPSVREVCRLSQILTQFIFNGEVNHPDIKQFEKEMGIKAHSTMIVSKELVNSLKENKNK